MDTIELAYKIFENNTRPSNAGTDYYLAEVIADICRKNNVDLDEWVKQRY